MLTQSFFDWVAALIAGVVQLLPPLPSAWVDIIAHISASGVAIGHYMALWGPLVPFDVINQVMNAWLSLLGLWAAVLVVRIGLFAAGR